MRKMNAGFAAYLAAKRNASTKMTASTPTGTASDTMLQILPRKSINIKKAVKSKKKLGKVSPKSKKLAPKKRMATKAFPMAQGPKTMAMKKNKAPKGYNFAAAEKKLGVVS